MSDTATLSGKADPRPRRNVAVLVACQAIMGSQMPMLFVVGGLVGNSLAPNPCLATLPISMIVLGSMSTAPWISLLRDGGWVDVGHHRAAAEQNNV